VVDLLYSEWYHKPVAISTVSDGSFGGSQVITSLQFVLWKMKAITVPAMFPNPNVKNELNEQGQALPDSPVYKRLSAFIAELIWCIEAVNKMK
ncbi:MAG TPA: FMN reductase, partial [Bacteroidia bacterium]|nr:FMN reductase [Bacteroidia bacterium]